jgi:hypothetical protein
MLKRFFYASASILILAVSYDLGATRAHAQAQRRAPAGLATGAVAASSAKTASGDPTLLLVQKDYQAGVITLADPSAFLGGTLPTPGKVGEIAVTQAILSLGDQVPLPVYSDGVVAAESEVFWTVQLWQAHFLASEFCGLFDPHYTGGDFVSAGFTGRTFSDKGGRIWSEATCLGGWTPHDVTVLVTAIAVRGGATPAAQQSWGKLKASYRK